MKVLIVEDERITRDQLSLLLKEWGYEVLTASDGKEAWEIAAREKVRLVITDIMMPGVDGIELCKRIRGMKNDFYTYILVITGMSDQKSLYDAMFAGADDFIVKPWHNAEVRVRLRTGERIIHLEDELRDRIKKLEEANLIIRSANERMMREVSFMSRMQSTLLPSPHAEFPGIKLAWKHQPYSMMAGDGLNIFRLDENNFAVFLVDVAASGPAASFLLASLGRKLVPFPGQPGVLKLLSRKAPGYEIVSPAKVVTLLNHEFPLELEPEKFFTIIYGILNVSTGIFTYASAGGQLPVVVRSNGKLIQADGAGKPIGKSDCKKYEQFELKLEKYDRLVLFSDGLVEIKDSAKEPFGKRKFKESLKKYYSVELEKYVEKIFKEGFAWSEGNDCSDDASVITIEFHGVNDGAS